jgi:hypothetical protein
MLSTTERNMGETSQFCQEVQMSEIGMQTYNCPKEMDLMASNMK